MSETVVLELSDTLLQHAHAIASQSQRRVEEVLVEWLELVGEELPVEALPDDQVLALRDMQMSEGQQQELSDLLARQREQTLDPTGQARLDTLMGVYRRGMVRKAHALKVAVERGLQPPLTQTYGA
jgi:hypothetical protein